MNKEVIRHPKLNIFVLIVLFVLLYTCVILLFEIANEFLNLGIGSILEQFIFLYIYSMFILRWQLHYYEYEIIEGHLVIREFLAKKDKTISIIPFDQIVQITSTQVNKDRYYNRRKFIRKRNIKNTKDYYVEYDDSEDISLIKIQCTENFITEVRNHI